MENNWIKTKESLPEFSQSNHKSFLIRFFEAGHGCENKQARDLMQRDYGLNSESDLRQMAERFNDHLTKEGETHATMQKWQQHFNSWMRKLGKELIIDKLRISKPNCAPFYFA